jgi:hypothetical protein
MQKFNDFLTLDDYFLAALFYAVTGFYENSLSLPGLTNPKNRR